MLDSGPDEPPAWRHPHRQMTRISKIRMLPQLEPSAKLQNRTSFSKFEMPHGSFFDAVHKNVVEIGFCEVSVFGDFRGRLKRSARALQLFGRLAVLETHTLRL